MAKPRHRALAIGLVSVLAAGCVLAPASASASVSTATAAMAEAAPEEAAFGPARSEEYEELSAEELAELAALDGEDGDAAGISLLAATRYAPVYLSAEMKYFAKFESGGNYDQGLSYGDGYNAVGYYQFDRSYSLIPFITNVYNYNPTKYAMFEAVIAQADAIKTDVPHPEDPDKMVSPLYDYTNKKLSALGELVDGAWHAAYKADPAEFSAFQDAYGYENYYKVIERIYRNYYGITLDNRADAVRGLAWSLGNWQGSGGMQKFIEAANINNAMTDREIATRLVDAIVDYYTNGIGSGSIYAKSFVNRYRSEEKIVLGYVDEDERQYLAAHYSDIDFSDWYVTSAAWVSQRGFMTGIGGTTQMAPDATTSRAMVVAVLSRLGAIDADSEGTGSLRFPDVSQGDWFAEAVAWGVGSGVVEGYGDGTFRPNQDVTREQVAIFLMRYAQQLGLSTAPSGDLSAYPDADQVGEWGARAMSWAVANGIITGKSGLLAPQANATRAEFATMLMRFCDLANI